MIAGSGPYVAWPTRGRRVLRRSKSPPRSTVMGARKKTQREDAQGSNRNAGATSMRKIGHRRVLETKLDEMKGEKKPSIGENWEPRKREKGLGNRRRKRNA